MGIPSLAGERSCATLAALALAAALLAGCGQDRSRIERGRVVDPATADRYVRTAIHKSSEGVVLYPSGRAEKEFDRERMKDLAQALRQPAARCFIDRAIARMEPAIVDGEPGYTGVPNGQAKIRARISPDGSVMTTEVLETGFTDEDMENCVRAAIMRLRFPASREGFSSHVDVVYWVSLGFHREANTDEFRRHMRREQTAAAVRAKSCFDGQVGPGTYEIESLSLFDRNGDTLANRVTRSGLPPTVSGCVATALRTMRIADEPESFVRPATAKVTVTVGADGEVAVADEEWLRVILLEERAQREERRRALSGESPSDPSAPADGGDGFIDPGEPVEEAASSTGAERRRGGEPASGAATAPPGDPAKAGTKLRLTPR